MRNVLNWRGLILGGTLVALMMLGAACAAAEPTATTPAEPTATTPAAATGPTYGGTLKVGMVADAFDFDPPVMVMMPSLAGLTHIYDNLVIRNPDGTLRPMLAESWETNDDASQWTFHLRQGVMFSHGKEFKAEDVIFTINRIFEMESALASVMAEPTDIVAVNDYTVRFEFDGPNAVFLESLVKYHAVITPSDVDPARFLTETFGTGPLIMTEHIVGERTIFRKNEDYFWAGRPYVDEVIFVYLASPEARAEALKAGTIDVIFDLDMGSVLTLEADPNTIVVAAPTSGYINLAMDVREAPFDNVLVRKAIQAVTDRQAILQIAQFGMGGIAYDHPIAVTDPVFNDQCKPPAYDVELAKSLLEQAGYADGLDLTLYTSTTGGGSMVELATVMKEKAAPAGINIEIINVPETGYWSDVWMKVPFSTVWYGGRPPYEAFSVIYPTDAAWNEMFWSNLEVDGLLDTAMGQADLADQKVTFGRLQCIVVDLVPRIIPVFRPVLLGIREEVKDLIPMPDFTLQLRETWLDQ